MSMPQGFMVGCRASDVHPTQAVLRSGVGLGAPALGGDGWPTMAASALSSIDLRKWAASVTYQIGSECVGESEREANAAALRGAATKGYASARGAYVGARVRERARKGDGIPDTGCQPVDSYDSIVAVGLYQEDARDFDPNALNAMDTWDESVGCKTLPTSAFVPLDDGDTDSVDLWLSASCPITYTINVDASFENSVTANSPIWSPAGSIYGLHRQCGLGFMTIEGMRCYVGQNSWGTGWGEGGFYFIPVPVFRMQASEIVVHRGGVAF